jgi:signal transduction histidine kinase
MEVVKRHELEVPFIIVSGTIGEDVAVEALRSGANDFFLKGKLTLLAPAVDRELREAAARRERRQMQEQLLISDRMASVGVLAAGVAHEINNPLGAVLGNLLLAQRAIASLEVEPHAMDRLNEVIEELRDAHEAAERIRDVAADLKLFARSDADELTAVDVQRVIESSVRMARTEIRHRASLHTSYRPVPPVRANASRLGQVFLNLIVNAAQAIPDGHADTNEISLATFLADDGRVIVEVGDTGSGIPPEVQQRLFTPFFTTKPAGIGTGLGLSICHRIITGVGGTIAVESEIGKGTTFRVSLLVADPVATTATDAPTDVVAPVRRAAVLVIDDEPAIGLLIDRALSGLHDVRTTTSASEALAWIADGARYDVIFCDLMMPQVTGMEFFARLREEVPEQAPAVVFITGGAFTTAAREFIASVENLTLEKPFDVDGLRVVVADRV